MDELNNELKAPEADQQTEQPEQVTEQVTETEQTETQTPADNPLAEELETLKKRLADTQSWAHQKAQEAAELRRQQDQRRLSELESGLAPEVLEAVDRASEARQLRQSQEIQRQEAELKAAIEEAVPDALALVENPEFGRFVTQEANKARAAGKDPANPLTGVAVMNRALNEYRNASARDAAEQAEKARKAKQMQAQSMPGAGAAVPAGKPATDWTQNADAVKNMSPAEFEKLRRKGLGY